MMKNSRRTPRPRRVTVPFVGLWIAALAISAATPSYLVAEALPVKGLADSRVRVTPYSADEVYRLYGYVGYQIDLQFEPGESFVGMAAGDIDGLSYVSQDNHLFLKPRVRKVSTNLTVLTSKRQYQFEYTAVDRHPDAAADEVMFAVRFSYPAPPPHETPQQTRARTDKALADGEAVKPRNVDYWFCGSPSIKPIAASDDGVHTRLRFAPKSELPAIFVRNDDGSESLLNFSMDDGDVVIHRVSPRFIVRRGRLTGCIVNQGFSGAGERLKSNTVAPQVEREIRTRSEPKGAIR